VRRVWYDKKTWTKSDAWNHLHAQMIPGCPKIIHWFKAPMNNGMTHVWVHGWRADHHNYPDQWAWIYQGE